MPVINGTTEVGGYRLLTTGLGASSLAYMQILGVEPSMSIPRLYADIVVLVQGLPTVGLLAEIAHQRMYLDVIEITLRRDYGAYQMAIAAKWAINGVPFRLTVL